MTGSETKPFVVVGVDGSQSSKDALRWAAKYAEMTGAEVRAVISYEFLYYSPTVEVADHARSTLEEAVSDVFGATPPGSLTLDVIAGHPAQVLIEASQSAKMLVVGSRGHGAFVRALLGSVSIHCAQHATCPVTVVRDLAE